MDLRHFTFPNCPVCGQKEKAIGDPEYMRWHCFACRSNGDLRAVPDTGPEPQQQPGESPE